MLRIKNISKKFGKKLVIDDISLDVEQGGIVFLLGASGTGKSTLLRMLNHLETIDSGSITLDDKPIDPKKDIGMVFQQFNLFNHLPILENIALALEKSAGYPKKDAQKIAFGALRDYKLLDKAKAYPHELSGGQKQRAAIARTVALRPKIICFDEPTSALDPLLTAQVAKTIQQLADEGYIIIIASHDTALLKKLSCDIYLIDDGRIIERGISYLFQKNPKNFPFISVFVAGAAPD